MPTLLRSSHLSVKFTEMFILGHRTEITRSAPFFYPLDKLLEAIDGGLFGGVWNSILLHIVERFLV